MGIMISLRKIFTVAQFEAKTLFRSWFFRIFTLLALVILIALDIIVFTLPQSSWMNRGLEASIPYMNLALLNVVQAIIAVFMASEFLKYDYKLDTTEAIYARSMTNADYVLGKTLGVLMVFMVLNILVLIISFIFNFFFTEIPVLPVVYFYYPLLISFPTLIFIFGLSFLFMVTIRNQAVTFIIILGYIASTLFFLSSRFHHIFDYMANSVPLMYSEMAGFGDISTILIHRGIYLSLGTGFIFASVVLMKRLSQSKAMTQLSAVFSILFIFCGFALGYIYIERLSDGIKLRENMRTLNAETIKKPSVSLTGSAISLSHLGKEIQASAALTFTNKTGEPVTDYRFSLNPGLKVFEVSRGGEKLAYDRTLHIITIKPGAPLAPGATDSLTISYRGKINEDAAYPDIEEKNREESFKFWVFTIDKRYGFIRPGYVLLTGENLWYPVAGVPYGISYPILKGKDFIKFELRVKTFPGLTAISQGKDSNPSPGVFEFKPEVALPQISLVIGNYEKRSITAKGLVYNLFIKPGHDYFSTYFSALKSKLPDLIDSNMADFERKLDISYPFSRLTLIEVPIQFYAYPRIWTSAQETVQPEQVFLPEKGVTLRFADFKRSAYFMKHGGGAVGGRGGGGFGGGGRGGGGGQTMTEEENQSNLFNRFVQSTFAGSSQDNRMMRQIVSSFTSGRNVSIQQIAFSAGMSLVNAPDYNLFPEFYTHVNHFHSDAWPILDVAMENYLKARSTQSSFGPRFFMGGASYDDNANTALQKQNLREILADPSKKDIASDVLSSKGNYLFSLLESRAGTEGFSSFISDFLYKNQYRDTETEELLSALNEKFKFDLKPYLDAWYTQKGLPAFIIGEMKCYEVIDRNQTRYQVIFTVTNPEPVEGLMSVSFMVGGQRGDRQMMGGFGGGFGASSSNTTTYVYLKGDETKEIGILLDSAPRMGTIKTFISQNLPSSFNRNFGKPEINPAVTPFEGERILDKPLSLAEPGEIIVDDEDAGFKTISEVKESFLKRLLVHNKDDGGEYETMRFWRPPLNWQHTVQGSFYGLYKHSAYYIKSGDGTKRAVWTAQIPESGNYNIYCYNFPLRGGMDRRGRGGPQQQQQQQKPSAAAEYHYLIHHDDGVEEVEFEGAKSPEGWNLLGTFYLSAGHAEVELTNKSNGPIVVADAIKWVKQAGSARDNKQ
jgi:hypothetical protein